MLNFQGCVMMRWMLRNDSLAKDTKVKITICWSTRAEWWQIQGENLRFLGNPSLLATSPALPSWQHFWRWLCFFLPRWYMNMLVLCKVFVSIQDLQRDQNKETLESVWVSKVFFVSYRIFFGGMNLDWKTSTTHEKQMHISKFFEAGESFTPAICCGIKMVCFGHLLGSTPRNSRVNLVPEKRCLVEPNS